MRFVMSGLVSCVVVLTACGGDDPNKADLSRFQGKWKAVSVMDGGKSVKAGFTWTIEGSKILTAVVGNAR